MRISRIDATPLAIPLRQEFHWASGAQLGANLVLFSVHTEDGVVGYGETVCEAPGAVAEIGLLMARQLVGRSVGDVEATWACARKLISLCMNACRFTGRPQAAQIAACWRKRRSPPAS